MLETIKKQYSKSKTLSKSNFYQYHSQESGRISSELFPLAVDYFHELNPAFLFKVSRFELLSQYPAVTVRDGSVSFGDFLLKNFQNISKAKTHYIIHPELARLVPTTLRSFFSSWQIVQKNQSQIKDSKRVILIGLMNAQSLPDLTVLQKQLDELKSLPQHIEIDIFLPIRSNPFGLPWKESFEGYQLIEYLRGLLPGNKFNYLTIPEMMEKTSWTGTYCIDLLSNNLAISDSYMNHHAVSRGAVASAFSNIEDPKSLFELDLSLNHKIQISPLPEVSSFFPEMIFYKKQSYTQNYASDPRFHALLRKNNS